MFRNRRKKVVSFEMGSMKLDIRSNAIITLKLKHDDQKINNEQENVEKPEYVTFEFKYTLKNSRALSTTPTLMAAAASGRKFLISFTAANI